MPHISEYMFSSGTHYHLGQKNCRWCNKFILFSPKIEIPIDNGESLLIPYCSRKCLLDDPNSTIYIESFKKQSASLKAAYLKQENEEKRTRKNEEVKKPAAAEIDNEKFGFYTIIGILFALWLFLYFITKVLQ